MLTKLALLIAEKAGWKLNRELTPFLSPSIKISLFLTQRQEGITH
ncbi:hypothetical protein HMSSN036_00050 [Paenibacillus macerans]|nr:hypothetical protein HMSSN036_00050 [Paenibacillus macerans]